MRPFALVAAFGAVLAAGGLVGAPSHGQVRSTTSAVTLAPGASATISLEENVTTGYSWRYDPAHSTDPGCVTIEDLGHAPRSGDPAVGAAGLHRWRLTGATRGHAELRFVYQRPWEQHSVREHVVAVDVR
ncbi:protease inhibitor I42 family protein [Rhodoplanes sp. TEM]|uniref:Protease inhibitor I42 family protein n=1 Tax=Rhodoplanes tepidamans TaxID=200616 RepID=A0ABT5J744_RHOTP|nr:MULTISPECIES: protease inhibitor I42 family protein [Rhodoplanes]MDC7785408.1 protease inhibitor I42 family protein [Rhodoplanes tepidamans]MDC7986963.1 protease inhibitor I42 family protein [Rhodoplanes sp. TEM]MDQ0353139.1 putative secreted protein [Rhodoplanes tepidamans]